MPINNFHLIYPLLTFNSDDDFYFVQIIQRKKDNSNVKGSNNSNRLIQAYYISSVERLKFLEPEMIHFADFFNARVGINLNKRGYYKTAFHTMQTIANQMSNKDFKNVRSAYNTACGVCNSNDDKLWILDVDDNGRRLNEMLLFIERECDPIGNKYVTIIPSRQGCHVITKPFNLATFKIAYPEVEVHKNNPTNLYIP
jgi:hypothetical protein